MKQAQGYVKTYFMARIGKGLLPVRGTTAILALFAAMIAGCTSYQATQSSPGLYFNPDTVSAGKFDNGKMWNLR